MDDLQWHRIMNNHEPIDVELDESKDTVNLLKHRTTFIKYKPNGGTYSRIYYLSLSEDFIFYISPKHKSRRIACEIKDIDQIRPGFTTNVWKKCLRHNRIKEDKSNLAFSILYHNNRKSLDLIAETEDIRTKWITALDYLVHLYQSHMRTHHEITDKWLWHLFSQADCDNTGYLNINDVRRLLFTLNIRLTDDDIDYYFKQSNLHKENYQELTHLNKNEFLIFYKFVSQRPELLKIICQFNGSTHDETSAILSEYSVIHKLTDTVPIRRHRLSFRSNKKTKMDNSASNFRRPFGSVIPKTSPSSDVNEKRNFLTIEQLKDFLQKEEHMKLLSIEDCSKLITRFEPSVEGRQCEEIGVDGLRLLLLHDEFCIINPDKTHRIYHDMTHPITDYFIATSHNTYLQNNQVFGDCTAEVYIHALRSGCRAVEIDCYDGDEGEPIVYHGHTFTIPIQLRDILEAIANEAFTKSPYPLFINVENHCSYEQQSVMARLFKSIFKDHLLTRPLMENFETLPSPEQLKYKILIRSRRYKTRSTEANSKSSQTHDLTESTETNCHPEFANLIIYSQIVTFTNISHIISTKKSHHSISIKESQIDDLINDETSRHLDLLKLTHSHMIRVYPRAFRQNSSNIHPLFYWTYGVQMVALNYQTDDESMCLQYGFFSDNGGCGYLLKPPCLLSNDRKFDPKEKFYTKGKTLHINVISGQHFPKGNNSIEDSDISDPYVRICTYGVECDYTEHRTPPVENNGLNPRWDYKISADIYCPDLCLVIFQVRDHNHVNRSKFLGQTCIPFNSLQLGYRHVKLRAKNGDYIHGTLFVHVNIVDF